MTQRFITLLLCGLMACLAACEQSSEAPSSKLVGTDDPEAAIRNIAVIGKAKNVFWRLVEQGVREAGEELGVRIIWRVPPAEDDRELQSQLVQQAIAEKVDGILLSPADSKSLLGPVRTAAEHEIPVLIFDSALEGEAGRDFVSFVATDNRAAGRMAGRHLARKLGKRGQVVLFRHIAGSASTTNREEGFLEAMAAFPRIEVISDDRHAGPTTGDARAAALEMVDQLRIADGVFASSERATYGMLQALRKEKLAGKVRFVGSDTSSFLREGLRSGEVHALLVQNPRRMGYLGVSMLVKHLNEEQVPARVDTGAVLVTLSNIDDPRVRPLLR